MSGLGVGMTSTCNWLSGIFCSFLARGKGGICRGQLRMLWIVVLLGYT